VKHDERNRMSPDGRERLAKTRDFFGARAAGWDLKFGHDMPAYSAAVAESGIPVSATVADVGCGTGRALPALRARVGPDGVVLAVDATWEMLQVARPRAVASGAGLVLADAMQLPLADRSMTAIFAAGLLTHLPDPVAALTELARVTTGDGTLVLFHPSGRASLAARHGHTLSDDDTMAQVVLSGLLARTGWVLSKYDDAADRFFALAQRCEPGAGARDNA
jgi:ubiquinone/menaquinone biosynthesis C-methylase UbiE